MLEIFSGVGFVCLAGGVCSDCFVFGCVFHFVGFGSGSISFECFSDFGVFCFVAAVGGRVLFLIVLLLWDLMFRGRL